MKNSYHNTYEEYAARNEYMKALVAETNEIPSFFKYCSFEGAYAMLSASNIQFTRADKLNDPDEVNISKCDMTRHLDYLRACGVPEKKINSKIEETKNFFSGIGVCSCGKSPENEVLWKKYATSKETKLEDGLCIELDQHLIIDNLLSKGIKTFALIVKYFDNVESFLPWELFMGSVLEKSIFFKLLYSSKNKEKWGEEDEVRLMYSEPFEGKHFRPVISSKCIKKVYYGKGMDPKQRIKIGQILNRYSHIRREFRK